MTENTNPEKRPGGVERRHDKARELLIEITQSECFAPIYVKLGHAQPG